MKTKPLAVKAPVINPDGTCSSCTSGGGWVCAFHRAESLRQDERNAQTLRRVVENARHHEIYRVCAQHELESDEFQTREDKARHIIAARG